MPVRKSGRYTPPKSFAEKSGARQGALRNMNMGLGAGNMGTSATASVAQNRAFDKLERINAFDAARSGRSTSKVRMVAGAGSGPTYTGAARPAGRSGYGGLASNSAIRQNAANTRGMGPAAMGLRKPLALPAAGESMASPAGTGYGGLVSRGNVARNAEALRPARKGTALERYRGGLPATRGAGGGPPALMRGSQNAAVGEGSWTKVAMGATRNKKTVTGGGSGAGIIEDALGNSGRFGKMGKGLLIGAGAAVIAGLAYKGRRGEGSSGGRTQMTRY